MVIMYDSIDPAIMPSNATAVAGYVAGRWPTFGQLKQQFPHAHLLSIAVNASEDAECLDVEPGDAAAKDAPAWVRRQVARGVAKPVLYASVSTMPTVLAELGKAGIARQTVRLWTAHYTYLPHLCGPQCWPEFKAHADATQFTDRALGKNLDESLCADTFFPAAKPPPPPPPKWFSAEVQCDPNTGEWRVKGMPFNAAPLGA